MAINVYANFIQKIDKLILKKSVNNQKNQISSAATLNILKKQRFVKNQRLKSVIKQEAPANRGSNLHTLNQTKTNYNIF
jgi:hypothetical protein